MRKFHKISQNNNFFETLYHGSDNDNIDEFVLPITSTVRGKGIFFSNSMKYAGLFGKYIYVAQINLNNPKIYNDSIDLEIDIMKHDNIDNLYNIIKQQRHDGIVILNSKVSTGIIEEVICFDSSSVTIIDRINKEDDNLI